MIDLLAPRQLRMYTFKFQHCPILSFKAFDLQALMAGRPSQSSSAATRPSSSHAGVKGSNPSSGSRN